MANQNLRTVFREIFDRDFNPDSEEDRIEMQHAAYLLQTMGISVGDYGFMWYKNGLRSQRLYDDMMKLKENSDVLQEVGNG